MSKKEKEIVIEVDGRSYDKFSIQSLLQRVDALRTSGEEMGKEITSLKYRIGGYKTSNAAYKRTNRSLSERIEKLLTLIQEGDELNEMRIKRVEEMENVNKGLTSQIDTLRGNISNIEQKYKECELALDNMKQRYKDIIMRPWYKRIFIR